MVLFHRLITLDGVFVQNDGNEHGGGDRDHGPHDAVDGGADDQGNDDGESRQTDRALHDLGGEVGVLHLRVDAVSDDNVEDAHPGVHRSSDDDQRHRDQGADDRDDVGDAHDDAERVGVANVQQGEDDGGVDAQDEHQRGLAEQPAAHADI